MLVLTRRQGESIVIGTDIVVTVIELRGGQVRIGIDAPRSVQVHRMEVFEQVTQANVAAVRTAGKGADLFRLAKSPAPAGDAAQADSSTRVGGTEDDTR